MNQAVPAGAFTCADGLGGPGIQSCSDQNGAGERGGNARYLDRRRAHLHGDRHKRATVRQPVRATVHYTVTSPPSPSPTPPDRGAVSRRRADHQTGSGATVSGTVNPENWPPPAFFQYGLDLSLRGPGASTTLYDQQTPAQQVGSDSRSTP